VAAVSDNGVIGRDGGLPWRLPTDLKHFKAVTLGKPVIMGRRTFTDELKKPLPGRLNIVVTRDESWSSPGVEVAHGLEEALERAHEAQPGVDRCVIGGGQIYQAAWALATRLVLTRVHAQIEGDTTLDRPDPSVWECISSELHEGGEGDEHAMTFAVWRRR